MGELSSHIVLGDQLVSVDHMRRLSLYNNNYTIYYKTDHCYGWNESLRMLSANLTLVSISSLSSYVCLCLHLCVAHTHNRHTHTHACMQTDIYTSSIGPSTCNRCKTGKNALPDMCTQFLRACAYISGNA